MASGIAFLGLVFLGFVLLGLVLLGLEFLGPETWRLLTVLILWCHPKPAVPNASHSETPLLSGDLIIGKRTFAGSQVTPSA